MGFAVIASVVLASAVSLGTAVLIETEWTLILPPVAALLPLLPLAPKNRARLCTLSLALLFAFVLLGALTIGLLYVPACLAMLVAVFLGRISGPSTADSGKSA